MKRVLAIALLLCMMLPLCACPGSGPSNGGPGGETNKDLWPDQVGDKNYGGEEVVVSVMDNYEYELFGEEGSQDELDQLLNNRNQALKDRFNVELVSYPAQTTGVNDQTSHYTLVSSALGNNNADFDFIAMYAWQSGKLILGNGGMYLDWRNDVPYCRDSIKAGAEWWPAGVNNDSTVCGHQYVAVSDACITAIEMAWVMTFNQELVASKNIPAKFGVSTMYEAVDEGVWTLDMVYNILKDENTNGGEVGKKDKEDTFGMLLHGATGLDAFAFSLGYHYVENDGVNEPSLWTVNTGTVATLNTLRNFTDSMGCYVSLDSYEECTTFFAERHAIFASMTLEWLKFETMHNMEDKFGVLPYPKLNSSQKNYLTGSQDHYSVLSVPILTMGNRLEMTGAVVEAISAYNYKNVVDLYYEDLLYANSRDSESIRMINLIMDGRVYDLSTYHYADLQLTSTDGNAENFLGTFFRYVIQNKNTDIMQYWNGSSYLSGDLQELIVQYESLANY